MTSTNDGKDVKSNQTSGHKGKSYYIELYKSLEKALSGENSLEARTAHVCEAWRRVYSLYAHSASTTHPHLLSWLQRHTAHIVLQSKWAESKNEHARLTAAIDALVAEATDASAGRELHPWERLLLQRAAWFSKTLGNPWGHPVLKSLINPNGDPVTDQQVLEWLVEERGIVLVTRIRQLVSAGNCDDLALLLAAAVMERARASIPRRPDDAANDKVEEKEDPSSFVSVLEREAGFTADVWELLTDIELVLLLKTDKRPKCIELAKLTPLRHGYSMVERLRNRLATSPRDKKLWKHAKEVATLVTQVIIARCMVLTSCVGVGRTALYSCARSLARLVPAGRLASVSNTLAAPAHTARHLHTFCTALDAQLNQQPLQCTEEMKPFICELYVRAITAGMNELEQLKLNADKSPEARSMEQTLASWFTQLGGLLAGSARLRAECALTAFSVHPATNYYERVAATPQPPVATRGEPKEPENSETTSEFGSWATDSRTQSNLVKTSETLQMKKTEQHQANVLSTAILTEGETLGLEPELCQDLAVLLSGPRVKTLSWDMDRNILLENCRAYMVRTDGGTRAVTTELKYLNLDLNAYRHLPEEEDDEGDLYYGIEKGYEHEVQFEDPEEIWQNAFFDPEQTESANDSEMEQMTKKKVRAPVLSSDDDEDPLSTIADAKREKKKLAKEKRKEQRRKKSHKRDGSKDREAGKERRKDKKTKKESKKDKSEQTTGSLTSLLGMKVSTMPSQVQDGQKKVRKKKERPRDSMFSYVSVGESDYDSQAKPQVPTDPNIVVDGVFSIEHKSPERSENNQIPVDNTKPTLTKSSSVQSPVINYIKSRPIVRSPKGTTSSDSHVSRAKSPFLKPLVNRHVVSTKGKSSIMKKLLQFRIKQNQIRAPPKIPVSRPPSQVLASDKSIPNQILVGMKIFNPEEVPTTYTKKQLLEAVKNEANNLINAKDASLVNYKPKIPCTDMSELLHTQNYLNVQKPSRQYTNAPREIIQNVFNETYNTSSEHLQHSPLKSTHQSNYIRSPTPSVIQTNYSSLTKSDMTSHALNLTPPKAIMAQRHFHKSMQNLSTDNINHESPKKPLLINDPTYFSQQQAKSSQLSPRIISNTIIKPPIQTVTKSQQYKVNIIKEDLIKSSQRHTELSRMNMSKGCAQNANREIPNAKTYFMKYGEKQLSSSMHNVNEASCSSNDINRHIFTPNARLHGNTSQSKICSGKPDTSYTPPAYYSNSSSTSRCSSVQDRFDPKSQQNLQTPKPVIGLTSQYQEFFKELAKSINAGSNDTDNIAVALNNEVKVTPVLTSKRADPVTPQCAKQTIQQKKTENAPNTFSRLSYMHKNKMNEYKLNDAVTMELNKNIMDHKICKAKYMNNEVTISRVGATHANVSDQGNVRKNEQACSKLQKACPVLSCMLDAPVKNSQTSNQANTNQSSSDTQTDREHADLLLLLRNQPILKTNPNTSVTSTSESTPIQSNTQTNIDHALVGAKVKNINTVLGNTLTVKQEPASKDTSQELKQVMNDILALKTEPLGPNALDMVLKKDYKRHSQSSSRTHAQKSTKISGDSNTQSKPPEVKKQDHSRPKSNSSSRKSSIEKLDTEIQKRHKLPDIIKKPCSTDMQKRLENHNKYWNSNTTKSDDPFISGIPNSAYDVLGDLMDDDLRRELGELSSDEEAYSAPNIPLTKEKSNTNIPKTGTTFKVTNVAKEKPHIVAPKTLVCKNESASNMVERSILRTHPTTGYTNVIANNASHIDVTRLPESHINATRPPDSHINATKPPESHMNATRPHESHMNATRLPECHMNAARLPESHMNATRLPESHMNATRLPESHMNAARLPESRMNATRIPESHMNATRLPESHMNAARLPESRMNATRIPESHMNATRLPESHINGTRLPESRQTLVCSSTDQPHTATVIANPRVQHTANNFIPSYNDPNCFIGNMEPANVIIASLPVPVPSQPVVVIRQDVYDTYSAIHIHESQVTAGMCSVNPNVYAINTAPNIAVYQTTHFAAPVINPVIIGNAMTTTNVSNAVAMAEQQVAPDSTSADMNTQEPDSTTVAITDPPINLDFNMNRNCERKVLSQVQEKLATENVEKDSVTRRLSVDDEPIKTKQDEERIKIKRQTLMNRKISHACFHPPIPLTYTPLTKNVGLGKLLHQDTSKNSTVKSNHKLLPNSANGMNKNVSVTGNKNVGASNENMESTEKTSSAKENQKTFRSIWLRSSKISGSKVSPDKKTKIRLKRNKIKLKVSDTVIQNMTNIENENRDSTKPTRISTRILNKNKCNKTESEVNKSSISAETQQNLSASTELIDFEEELSGSKILKTSPIAEKVLMKELNSDTDADNMKLEDHEPSDITAKETGNLVVKKEALPVTESRILTNSCLEPTVVIEKLKNNLGDQVFIKSLPVKAPAKETITVAMKRLNRTGLRSRSATNDYVSTQETCMSNKMTVKVSKNAGSARSLSQGVHDKNNKSPITSPVVVLDKTKLDPAIVVAQKAMQQTDTIKDLSATTQLKQKDLPSCANVVHESEVKNNHLPTFKDKTQLDSKKTVPAAEILANKVVTRSGTSRTIAQNTSSPSYNETQTIQASPSVPTVPEVKIVNVNPVRIEQKDDEKGVKETLNATETTTSIILPNEVNTVIQNVPSLPKDQGLQDNKTDPKPTASVPPLVAIKPAQIEQRKQVVEQAVTINDTKTTLLNDETEQLNSTDLIKTTPILMNASASGTLPIEEIPEQVTKIEKLNNKHPKVSTPLLMNSSPLETVPIEVIPEKVSKIEKLNTYPKVTIPLPTNLSASETVPIEVIPEQESKIEKLNNMDPKVTVPLPTTLPDPTLPFKVLSDSVSKAEKHINTDPIQSIDSSASVVVPIEVMPEKVSTIVQDTTSLTNNTTEKANTKDFKPTTQMPTSETVSAEVIPKVNNSKPTETPLKTLPASETVLSHAPSREVATTPNKTSSPIARKDNQQVMKQSEVDGPQNTKPNSVLSNNVPCDMTNKDELIKVDSGRSLLCYENLIEISDDESSPESNASEVKKDDKPTKLAQEKCAVIKENSSINEATTPITHIPKKAAPITDTKQQGPRKLTKGDIIKIVELPVPDGDKTVVRITLANGKNFKATISGNINGDFDTLFSDPLMTSVLRGDVKAGKRYTVNYKHISKTLTDNPAVVLDTKIQGMNIKEKAILPVDTINLISDDEEELESRNFVTEFGKYRTNVDQETYNAHQKKFDQKCIVKLYKENFFKSNKTKPKPMCPSVTTPVMTRTMSKLLSDVATAPGINPVLDSKTKTKDDLPAISMESDSPVTKEETLETPPLEQASDIVIPDFIEIDDSSNDSDPKTDNGNVEPVKKILALKNLLLQDLGVEPLGETDKNITLPVKNKPVVDDLKNALLQDLGVVAADIPIIDITSNEDDNDIFISENTVTNITPNNHEEMTTKILKQVGLKDCVIKISKCDNLVRRYEIKQTMKKCYVKLERLNHSVHETTTVALNDETNNEETDETSQENCEELIEFDVEESYSSPQLSRYPSLSILNNWDDECQPSTDGPSCSSPVMETYDLIVQLHTRPLGQTDDSQNNFFYSCASEWRLTKLECRTQEIYRSSLIPTFENEDYNIVISDRDNIVSDHDKLALTFKAPKLSTLTLNFLEDNPHVINRLQSTYKMRRISKTNTPPNKLKRKIEVSVNNTSASKILKLGTLALNTFNSYMTVVAPIADGEENIRCNPDKCILVEVLNKHHDGPSITEDFKTEDNRVTTTEENIQGLEQIMNSDKTTDIESKSNQSVSNESETDLKEHADGAEKSLSSNKEAEFIDEQIDASPKEASCNEMEQCNMNEICVQTEAFCKQLPNNSEDVFSSACIECDNLTGRDFVNDDFDEVSLHENTKNPDTYSENEDITSTINTESADKSKTETLTEMSDDSSMNDTNQRPPVNKMDSQVVDKSRKTNEVASVVRVIVDDILDKISHTEKKVETTIDCVSECSENDYLDRERNLTELENEGADNKSYSIETSADTKDENDLSENLSIQETAQSDSVILNKLDMTIDTSDDIVRFDDEKSTAVDQKETAKESVTKNIESSKFLTDGGYEPKDKETGNGEVCKLTSLALSASIAGMASLKETQLCTDINHKHTESNVVDITDSEQYEIPIEHLFYNLYEVEISDTQMENNIDIVESVSEPSPEPIPVSPFEAQCHDAEIKSPVFIDSKQIAFNYHDYTKRPKHKENTAIEVNAMMPCVIESAKNHDSDILNEESVSEREVKNSHEKTPAETSETEVNSINGKYSPNSTAKCKYELIQDDDWLTVIKTENDKDDNETSDPFVGPIDEEKTVVASLCSKNTTINIKGFEYDDVYIFPLSAASSNNSNTSSDSISLEMNSECLKNDSMQQELHDIDYSVIAPKVTYSRKCLKRKIDMRDVKVAAKKYRKGKYINYPKLTTATMAESAYAKEYKRLLEYCSSIKFSYSWAFHKELVEVDDLVRNWPINNTCTDVSADDTDVHLFRDIHETDTYQPDPATQTLAEEISCEYANSDATQENPSNEASEQNFSMGFGEGSGRVIQILKKGGESNISAATLSDVKQSQPGFKSVDHDTDDLKTNTDDLIKKIRQHVNFIELRDKVRSFFKKSTVELKYDWLQENKEADTKSRLHAEEFPFYLCSLNYVKPPPTEAIVQVVQVGQLPVSAAAQNPVTCDPRVTQVSDASPSQCSVDNSPNDDSQSEIKTEYTELTTADLTLPLQEYAQQNQASMNLASHDSDVELTEQTISLEMEIKEEGSPEIKEEMPDIKEEKSNSSDTELHTLTNATPENVNYSFENNTEKSDASSVIYDSSEHNSSETFSQQRQQNGTSEKTDQIAHAMNAAGITTTPETITNTRAHALVNILSQKIRQGSVNNAQTATNTYSKTTSINAMALQQALAQILPPPLNQTGSSENNQSQSTSVGPQVLHIVQGKNASGNQITLVDNSQQSVISAPNATQVLHIVQNKSATPGQASNGTLTPQANSFSGLSLVDAGLQQGGNQLLHIVNTGNQKTANPGQLLKRVNLLTNLTNVQGSNEQKMVQFVCKSADGKAIQLNAPHQRSMVLRLQPIETPNVQTPPAKPAESQELNTSPTSSAASKDSASQQEIKSRSIYEENYAKFIQNSSSKTSNLEKSTSLPKFNQAFGKPVFQEGSQKQGEATNNNSHLPPVNSNTENSECPATDNAISLEHIRQISSPPLLLRKQPAVTSQSQPNIVQQIKQTIAPMNIQTMHGGVIYTRQIPVNIGGGQTINLITVPSTELINEDAPKSQTQTGQGEIEPSIIKIVPQSQTTTNAETTQEESNSHASGSSESTPTPQPQPVLTQMRIKLPMLSKAPQMVPGARVVRPSFFQIQRNVIGGANQPVYQQLVLTAAPPLGQQTIRLPQAQASRPIKVPSESQSSSSESQMSSSTLEQLREFDMVLEQVKERSTVQPSTNTTTNSSFKIHTSSSDTTDGNASSNCSTDSTPQVLYSIGNNQSLNVAYVNRKTTITTPTTSTYVRSPDSTGIADSPTSSTHVQIPHTVTTDSSPTEMSSQSKPSKVSSKSKSRPKSTSNPPNTLKLNTVPPKPSSQKPLEDEQTTQRILYILAEYKEQVENSPDKDKPAPRRRSNPPSNPGSSKRKKSSSSRRSGTREMSPVHGEDTCRTMGSEDSSCGTSQGDCNESCLDSHSPQDSPRKVARKITFDQELTVTQPRPQPQRNVIVADGQTITVARGTTGKPATAVLMPANYILPVSMVKGGQQIAIVTNRGPKILTVGGEGGATNALLLQRLIGPAGLKPVLARPGVRHVRLPTAALHNLQAFNLATATTVQPPDSTASPTPGPTPPELSDTRATSSPWTDRDDVKPERGSSPEGSEPWNLPSSADAHEYTYEETVRTDNMDRTVLDPIPDRYSPDMEAQRIFDKMFDVDSKKSYAVDSPRCAYDIDPSDCDDKPYQVVQKKDGTQRQHRLSHVSAAALRHKYAILEHELRLQKSLSEECEDLGVDSPSASELFPEAELLFAASPAHEHNQEAHHSHTPQPLQPSSIPQPDMDDQIATDHLIPREIDVSLGLGDVGIVAVSEDGMQATIALDQEEFARSHPNTTFHSEPTEGEVQPFTITGLKGRHITSTIFHSNSAPATVLMAAPQATVISQAPDHGVKYEIENMINSMPSSHNNDINLSSVLVKDDGLTRFDSILTDSRELHLTNTASAIVHSSGNATQVIRRVCYEDDKRERDTRYLIDEPDNLIAGDDAKMIAEDSSRDATLESMADVDDDRSSPERHAELFWESNSASERSESRRPLDFSSDSDKCCKSPSFDETNSTDSSGVGTHMRLDSVIKEARGRERSGSADGSSADDAHPPLRTYPPKRLYHPLESEEARSLSGKTRAGERSPDSLEVRRRASGRGVVKRGCHCCNGSPAPPRPKKPRQRKPTLDFNTNT